MRSDTRAATARVIRQKRSVLRSSLAVVYGCAREVLRTPALRVLVTAGLLVRIGTPVTRTAAVAPGRSRCRRLRPVRHQGAVQACGSTAQRVGLSIGRSVVVSGDPVRHLGDARQWLAACVEPGVGAAEGFASPGPAPVRWAPGLVAATLVGVLIGLTSAAADLGRLHALVTAAIAFGWSYVAAYVLQAIAIHGKGLIGSVRAAVGVLRATSGCRHLCLVGCLARRRDRVARRADPAAARRMARRRLSTAGPRGEPVARCSGRGHLRGDRRRVRDGDPLGGRVPSIARPP